MNKTTPALHCAARSKINLDVQQFRAMHTADRAKANWSGERFQLAQRQLGLHDAACPGCSEAMHQ